MKKITFALFTLLSSFSFFAQTNEQTLLTNTWYLAKIEVNNEIIFPPFIDSTENSVLQFSQVNGNYSFTKNQCVNQAQGNLSSINDTSLHIDDMAVTLSVCPNNNLEMYFISLNTNVFWNNLDSDFQYTITTENELLQLEIVGANGNKAFYYNNATANTKSFNKELLKVYPNPSVNFLNISITNFDKIVIYDMLGKQIIPNYFSNENGTQVDIQQLSKGNYILQISEEKQTETVRFIKK